MLSPAHSPQLFTFGRPVASTPCALGADSRNLCVKRVGGGAGKVDSAFDFARGWGLHQCNSEQAQTQTFWSPCRCPAGALLAPLANGAPWPSLHGSALCSLTSGWPLLGVALLLRSFAILR